MDSLLCRSVLFMPPEMHFRERYRQFGGGKADGGCLGTYVTFNDLSRRSMSSRSDFSHSPVTVEKKRRERGRRRRPAAALVCTMKDFRDRIQTVKNTQKIADAMRLVAAAKVRKAQEAVVNSRPFSHNLVKVLFHVNSHLQNEDIDMPLTQVR